jgi:predicted Na+-dependent transporter
MFTYWTHGNVALSITMSFFSTLAAMGMLPFLIFVLIKTAINAQIEIPWDTIVVSLILILIPCGVGLVTRYYNTKRKIGGKFIWQWLELIASVIGLVFLLSALVFYLITSGKEMITAPASLWISAILMEPLGALFGYVSAMYLGLNRKDCRTIGLETGVQNVTLTIAIVALSFEGKQRDEVMLFPLLYGLWYIINSTWLVLFLRLYVAPMDDQIEEGEVKPVPTVENATEATDSHLAMVTVETV